MCGYRKILWIMVLALSTLGVSATKKTSQQRRSPQRRFFSVSMGNWQEACRITGASGTRYDLNSTTLGLGVGLGYVIPSDSVSFVLKGQVIYGNADIGFRPEEVPAVDFSGQNLSLLGVGIDFSSLFRLQEGVAVGFGVPIVGTFFLNKGLGSGYTLNKTSTIGLGAFINLRIRRNTFVFSPKLGFLNTLRAFYASMDFNFHF